MALDPINQAAAHLDAGRLAEAEQICRAILQREANHADAWRIYGLVAQRAGQLPFAIQALAQAATLRPNVPEYCFELGNALRSSGDLARAIEAYQQALRLRPGYVDVLVNLGIAQANHGQREQAERTWQEALRLKPDDADALANLGTLYRGWGRIGESIDFSRRALAVDPKRDTTLSNLGVAYEQQGRLDEAIAHYRRALAINPRSAYVHSNVLLDLVYHDRVAPEEVFAEHRRWNETFARPFAASIAPHANDRSPDRRLRIGYVSPDFRDHAVAFFMEPILAQHDRERFEIFCYFAAPREDAVTQRLKSHGHAWRSLFGVRDAQAAEMIRADAIDVLVDLAVHTSGHRLTLFARKPAPVQVTYLGYAGTTGMDVMDWRLTDAIVDPPGQTESLHTEQLYRLPRTQWCYQPPADAPAVASPPSEKLGHVTFGCATNLAKVTGTTLDVWSAVLRAVPSARFALLARSLADESTRRHVEQQFATRGIEGARLTLVAGGDLRHYLDFFAQVDVVLDTHPFAGGTTSCHTLWMGVPVVTLTGRTSVSRVAASVLTNVGLPDLIADTPAQFTDVATRLAADAERRSRLRAELRDQVRTSPLCDSVTFTRDLESAYRDTWQTWCRS